MNPELTVVVVIVTVAVIAIVVGIVTRIIYLVRHHNTFVRISIFGRCHHVKCSLSAIVKKTMKPCSRIGHSSWGFCSAKVRFEPKVQKTTVTETSESDVRTDSEQLNSN